MQLVVDEAVCLVIKTVADVVDVSAQVQPHPCAAVGNEMTPLVAVPPVPTFTVKTAVPLPAATNAPVPNPLPTVGNVRDISICDSAML